jgi:tetratricopeptide (TPR) repeat protein
MNSSFFFGMVSMLVFAFFSYPFSLWEFLVLFLLFAANAGCNSHKSHSSKVGSLLFAFGCLVPIAIFHKSAGVVRTLVETEKLWKRQRPIFDSGDYGSYEYCCSQLYPDLQFNCAFLYEYAYSLFEDGKTEKSEKVLEQCLSLSGNSLSFILLGDIHKKQGLIAEAEQDYYNSFLALPDRLYPLYKLAVLYYDSNQEEKYQNMVRSIEVFHPRIESESTNQIREMLKRHSWGYEKTM